MSVIALQALQIFQEQGMRNPKLRGFLDGQAAAWAATRVSQSGASAAAADAERVDT